MKEKLDTARKFVWALTATALGAILIVWVMIRAQNQDYQVFIAIVATIFVTWSWNYWKNDEQDEQGDILQNMIQRDQTAQFNATRAELNAAKADNSKLTKQLRATQEQLAHTADALLFTQQLAGTILNGNIKHLSTVKGQGNATRNN